MQGNIAKTAKNKNNYRKEIIFYKNARDGFSEILKKLKKQYSDYTLILPGFIGYSPNEGSGIFDPINNNNIKHIFYPLTRNLEVDIEKYEKIIESIENKIVVLLVHYFGYVDSNITRMLEIAKRKNAFIIEDCAHALYTDFVDNACGNYADVSIYSLHKMLPFEDGGMIKINNNEAIELEKTENFYNLMEYNLKEISNKRKRNVEIIEHELKGLRAISIIRPMDKYKNQTPQTYPILIEKKDKNELYHILNDVGFGVVSLYHTMIEELRNDKSNVCNEVASKILNLPVHQDAEEDDMIKMCNFIKKVIGE